jgi:hypothetical protein
MDKNPEGTPEIFNREEIKTLKKAHFVAKDNEELKELE